MADRVQLEGTASRLVASPVRSEFAVKAPPPSAELPELAVAGVSASYQASTEVQHGPDTHAILGLVWNNLEKIQRNDQRQKELDLIFSRLLGNRAIETQKPNFGSKAEIEADIKVISALAQDKLGPEKGSAEALPVIGQEKEATNAAERVDAADKDRVLARIEQALKNVGKLRSALASETETAYDRLVNLNSSVNDLNLARSRVDDAGFGLRSASDAVDAVMLHMRAALVAHGKMSPELVRLVLS
jgi:flagellin-like hook-associated protein FlgL